MAFTFDFSSTERKHFIFVPVCTINIFCENPIMHSQKFHQNIMDGRTNEQTEGQTTRK